MAKRRANNGDKTMESRLKGRHNHTHTHTHTHMRATTHTYTEANHTHTHTRALARGICVYVHRHASRSHFVSGIMGRNAARSMVRNAAPRAVRTMLWFLRYRLAPGEEWMELRDLKKRLRLHNVSGEEIEYYIRNAMREARDGWEHVQECPYFSVQLLGDDCWVKAIAALNKEALNEKDACEDEPDQWDKWVSEALNEEDAYEDELSISN